MNRQPRPMSGGEHPHDPTGALYRASDTRFDPSRAAFDSASALFDLTNLLAEASLRPAPSETYRPRSFPVRAPSLCF